MSNGQIVVEIMWKPSAELEGKSGVDDLDVVGEALEVGGVEG